MNGKDLWLRAVIGAALLGVACSAEPSTEPAGTATSVPGSKETSSATANVRTPTAAPRSQTRTLQILSPASPPAGSQLFIVTGCEACDGPDETLQLHETDALGVTTVTTLIGSGATVLGGMTIGQIQAAADGTVLAVAACADTYCGGLGNRANAIDWRVLVSVNDGADWKVVHETRANYAYIEDITAEGLIVGEVVPDGSVPSPQRHTIVNLMGQKRAISSPPAAGPSARAMLLWAGQSAWMEYSGGGPSGRLFREDGTQIYLPSGSAMDDAQSLNDGRLALFSTGSLSRLSLYAPGPNTVQEVILGGNVPRGITEDGTTVVANNFVSGAGPNAIGPILIDLTALTATSLTTEFLKAQTGRNRFVAFDRD